MSNQPLAEKIEAKFDEMIQSDSDCQISGKGKFYTREEYISAIQSILDEEDKHPINKEPLGDIYREVDKIITDYQDKVKEFRWESPSADDSVGEIHGLADYLAVDLQEIFKKLFPHIPQLNFFDDNKAEPVGHRIRLKLKKESFATLYKSPYITDEDYQALLDIHKGFEIIPLYTYPCESKSTVDEVVERQIAWMIKAMGSQECPSNCHNGHIPYMTGNRDWESDQCEWCACIREANELLTKLKGE